jgi:hypothetical protein
MGFDKNGYYLEIDGPHEAIDKLKHLLGDKGKKIEGKEEHDVLKKLKEDEEAADQGFGALFG